jgi:hypothetical protein
MHGHGHAIPRLELGYLLSAAELRQSDAELDGDPAWQEASSINTISSDDSGATFAELLRGPASLGALYAANGFPAVPSASVPEPLRGEDYFSGGFNTDGYTCSTTAGGLSGMPGGNVCGVQMEANRVGVRDTATNRARFADVTAAVLEEYLGQHWGIQLGP